MRPKVSEDLRYWVTGLVENLSRYYWGYPPWEGHYDHDWLPRIVPDVLHFVYQNWELERRGIRQFAALFRDDGPKGETLPVIVRAPDLQNLVTSYENFLAMLRETKLELKEVSSGDARIIFIDRLAEFIAVADNSVPSASSTTQSTTASPVTQTVVNSKRSGDTVIYCQGYFTSTAAGFGLSTPAVGTLSPGRYSFGIMNGGLYDFENILWTCPNIVPLKKP